MQKQAQQNSSAPLLQVILAFAIVYVVWGSTYFFIQRAIVSFPPLILGAVRFFSASVIMLAWCIYKKENLFKGLQIKHAIISGLLLLFVGNGVVIWVEQFMPSALVAIMVSSSPLWFVLLDKPKWSDNLGNRPTIIGLIVGFVGVILLFYKSILKSFATGTSLEAGGMLLLTFAAMSWAGGSLYSKYKGSGSSAVVNSTWQMFTAAIAFGIGSIALEEHKGFHLAQITPAAWWSVAYLVVFGSLIAFSAYVWLLEVRPATQVSTYAYVNPVVAVILGVFFAGEEISWLQISGLAIILLSVMMINYSKYRTKNATVATVD